MASGIENVPTVRGTWTVIMPRNTFTIDSSDYKVVGGSLIIANAQISLSGSESGNAYIQLDTSGLPTAKSFVCGWWGVGDSGGDILESNHAVGNYNTWFIKSGVRTNLTSYIGSTLYIKMIYEI